MRTFFSLSRIILLSVTAAYLSSCSHALRFRVAVGGSGLKGNVWVTRDLNGNFRAGLTVTRRDRMPGVGVDEYIVWMTIPANDTVCVGRLVFPNTSGRIAVARLETVSVYRPSGFFVTAHSGPGPAIPGQGLILSTALY
jgi:hypothetical protein